ncbi:MAG: DUF1638 domain-containing protein [Methanomassiliicoccales archaeon]
MTKIGIIACETLKREIDHVIQGDPSIVHVEYLEFGLHTWPAELRKAVVERVNNLEGKVDAVLLGYGICNSLQEITTMVRVPTVRFDVDDCVGCLMTTDGYNRERKVCAGTFFATPAFCDMGTEWFKKELRKNMPNYEELGIDEKWFLERMFDGYSRVLYIDPGLEGRDEFERKSMRFAEELKLRHESCVGTLDVIREALEQTKKLALVNQKDVAED